VVLRLLDKQAGRLGLSDLGMDDDTLQRLRRLIHRPHGVLLVTGPTGSGKSTTLYAALMELNDRSRNIMTVEDPIEYDIDGIGQTQVNPKVELTFARGLRAILRQDPDVVMVGEIRDAETARIAIQASMTGHLVLSTLHTNTAVGAINRLVDMGIEPFLLSSSLIGVMAQRLVRRLDPDHRRELVLSPSELSDLGIDYDEEVTLYRPAAELPAGISGYSGRVGIYELVEIDEEMQAAIHRGAPESELTRIARRRSPGILDDGWRKVRNAVTSLDDVLRVTRER
jgi:general secretion pathway protein E